MLQNFLQHTVPDAGYKQGAAFGYGFDYGAHQKWVREEGNFNIGTSGDSVIVYCLKGDNSVNPLVAYSNNNKWYDPGLNATDYGTEGSALPDELKTVGSIVLPHLDNYEYKGPMQAEKSNLQKYMMDPANWRGTNKGLGGQSGGLAMGSITITLALIGLTALTYGIF